MPQSDDLWFYLARSKVTSDFIVDRLEPWWQEVRLRFLSVKALVINLENGAEYYPPYHSKDNSIERCWGALEMPWNGSLLDSVEAVVGFAGSMTWNGKHPKVSVVETTYATGVRLKQDEMKALESQVVRLPSLEKWFVEIPVKPSKIPDG